MKKEKENIYPDYEKINKYNMYKNINEYQIPENELSDEVYEGIRELIALLKDNEIDINRIFRDNHTMICFDSLSGDDIEKIYVLLRKYGFLNFNITYYRERKNYEKSVWGYITFNEKKMEYMPLNYVPPKTNGEN